MSLAIRDRVKELRRVPASSLLPSPKNWRTHPEAQSDALRGVLAQIGFAGAELCRELPDGSLMLIDGHLRAEVSGDNPIPCLVLDVTEAEADILLATFDPLGAMATTDAAKLDALLQSVAVSADATKAMLDELGKRSGCPSFAPVVVTEDDFVPGPAVVVTKPGDVWILGDCRMMCGDSRNPEAVAALLGSAEINIAFTSPPYASQRDYDESSGFRPIPPDDYVDWWEPIQAAVKQHLAADGSFFVNIKPCADELSRELYVFDLVIAHVRRWGWLFAEEFCWERNGIPQRVARRFKNQFEPVFQFAAGEWKFRPEAVKHLSENVPKALGKGAGDTNAARRQGHVGACDGNDIAEGMAYPGNRLPTFSSTHEALGHAAAFPVGLPAFFIKAYTDPGDVVYEPFSGSGSAIIAAQQLNRRCFAMEISPQYCDIAVARWERLTGCKAMRESVG